MAFQRYEQMCSFFIVFNANVFVTIHANKVRRPCENKNRKFSDCKEISVKLRSMCFTITNGESTPQNEKVIEKKKEQKHTKRKSLELIRLFQGQYEAAGYPRLPQSE